MSKILVVDDDKDLLYTVRQWLELEHHLVEFAHDGRDAQALLGVGNYDLIILDWNLPLVSGIELCQEIRSRKCKTPILFLTGRDSEMDKIVGLDTGADDYLTKPFSMKELSARIRALLRRATRHTEKYLRSGDIILDTINYRVTKAGLEIHMYPADFALLEFLMRHAGELFSGDALMQRVWKSDTEATLLALRSAVKRIRKQLDEGNEDDDSLIETKRNVGYRFTAAVESVEQADS